MTATETTITSRSSGGPSLDFDGLAFSDDGQYLIVTSESRHKALSRPKSLSFSAAESFSQCEGRWVGSQTFRSESTNPFEPNHLGSAVHGVMELVCADAPTDRTVRSAFGHIDTFLTQSEQIAQQKGTGNVYRNITPEMMEEWRPLVQSHLASALALEDYQRMEVLAIELDTGRIPVGGNGQARIKGHVDRVSRFPGVSPAISLDDYKTGAYKAPYRGQRNSKQDQLNLYFAALSGSDSVAYRREITAAKNVYTAHDVHKVVNFDLTDQRAVSSSVGWFVSTYDELVQSHSESQFKLEPSPLCAWCPLANICPQAMIGSEQSRQKIEQSEAGIARYSKEKLDAAYASVAKAKKAAATQPSPVDLPIPTVRSAEHKLAKRPRILQFDSLSVATKETIAMTHNTPMVFDNSVPVPPPSPSPFSPPAAPPPPGAQAPAAPAQQPPAAPPIQQTQPAPPAPAQQPPMAPPVQQAPAAPPAPAQTPPAAPPVPVQHAPAPAAPPAPTQPPAAPPAPVQQAPAAPPVQQAPAAPPVQQAPAAPPVQQAPPAPVQQAPAAPAQAQDAVQVVRVATRAEDRPYFETVQLADGSVGLNYASYAAAGLFGEPSFALRILKLAGVETPQFVQIESFTRSLHRIKLLATAQIAADPTQVPFGVVGIANTTAQMGAMTRVSGLLREVVETYYQEIPFGDTSEQGFAVAWEAWISKSVARIVRLGRLADSMHGFDGTLTAEDYNGLSTITTPTF